MIERLPDWEARLAALLADAQDGWRGWGVRDCALWGADWVLALTEKDHGAVFRGQYDDAEGAAAALRAFGKGTIVRTFDAVLPRISPAFARRGDLALTRTLSADDAVTRRMGSVGGILGGDAVFVSDNGLERRARADWTICWAVGAR